jgi:hypothetical protein
LPSTRDDVKRTTVAVHQVDEAVVRADESNLQDLIDPHAIGIGEQAAKPAPLPQQ